jgi:hypothetical protein
MWGEDLPHLAFAFNTALHESTQSTPALLFLGHKIRSFFDSRWDLPSLEVDVKSGEDQALWTRACENLKAVRRRVARRFNERRSPHQYNVGGTVMFKRNLLSNKAQNITAKLSLRWSEPLVISKVVNQNNVLLANPNTGVVVRKAHVNQLKRYFKYL